MTLSSAIGKQNTQMPASSMYERSSGLFTVWAPVDDGGTERCVYECHGYAGAPGHVNSPGSSALHGLGPLPSGEYHVGLPVQHPRLGPVSFRLRPMPGTMMFGRSDFWIHGDNSDGDRSASNGCIVLTRRHREVLRDFRVRSLTVT